MSGQAPNESLRPDFAARGFDFLSKPFRPDGLLRAVRGAIDRTPLAVGSVSEGPASIRPSLSL